MRLLLVALLVLAPLASAGSAEDPEISDPANDQTYAGIVPVVQPPTGVTVGLNSDLLDGWVEAFEDRLVFSIQVQGTAGPTTTSSSLYSFHFAVDGTDYLATAKMEAASPVGSGSATAGGVASEATSASSLITVTVPLEAIGSPGAGDVVTGFYVTAEGILLDEVGDFTVDRAPDEGFGRDFVLPSFGAAVTYVDLEVLPLANETVEPFTGTVQYNWTGAAPLRIVADVTNGSMTLNLSADGTPVFEWSNGTSLDETVQPELCLSASCAFTLSVVMDGFVGAYSVDVVPEPELEEIPEPAAEQPSGNATDNETLPDELADKDTPGLGFPIMAVTIALAVLRRR